MQSVKINDLTSLRVNNSPPIWNFMLGITDQAFDKLTFWKDNLTKINGIPFWPVQTVPAKIVYWDASARGCTRVINIEGHTFHQFGVNCKVQKVRLTRSCIL